MHEILAQQAIALLVRRLADPVSEVADAALDALRAYGTAAVEQIAAACADADIDRAQRALRWLAAEPSLSLAAPPALLAVVQGLRSAAGEVRAAAAASLGELLAAQTVRMEPDCSLLSEAPDLLCQACRDDDPQVREAAAAALGHCAAASAQILDALQHTMGDNTSRAVREAAARSLGRLADRFVASAAS